jgi:hypothetical protein
MINKLQLFTTITGHRLPILLTFSLFFLLAACEGGATPDLQTIDGEVVDMGKRETIFGDSGGISLGNTPNSSGGSGGPGIGVNAFLWRATLDTMSVWPIASADPFGGVIITDWYAPPATPKERFKMNIYILDRALRADGVRVSVFRQVRNTSGGWQDSSVQPTTATKLENAILMRARQFRNRSAR